MKVLLVEDSEADQVLFSRHLRDTDIQLSYASSLKSALEALAKESFDCVMIDPGLPDSIPTETVKIILDHNPDATAVVISGNTDPMTVSASVLAGAHAYMHKNSDLRGEDVLRVIKDAVIRRQIKSTCG